MPATSISLGIRSTFFLMGFQLIYLFRNSLLVVEPIRNIQQNCFCCCKILICQEGISGQEEIHSFLDTAIEKVSSQESHLLFCRHRFRSELCCSPISSESPSHQASLGLVSLSFFMKMLNVFSLVLVWACLHVHQHALVNAH